MLPARKILPIAFLAVFISAAAVSAQTSLYDLVKLKAAGVSDAVLIALIESDRSEYRLNAEDILDLRQRGFSDRLILAMIATTRPRGPLMTGRDRPPQPRVQAPRDPGAAPDQELPATAPPVGAVGNVPARVDAGMPPAAERPIVEQVIEFVGEDLPVDPPAVFPGQAPLTINVTQRVEQHVESPREPPTRTRYVEVPVAVPVAVPYAVSPRLQQRVREPEPVYWGWGGQRAPGSWQPPVADRPAPRHPSGSEKPPVEAKPVKKPNGSGR